MQFYLTSAVVDKGVMSKTYKGERIDTVTGAILGDIVSIFVIIATAAAIGGTGPLNDVGQTADALRPASAGDCACRRRCPAACPRPKVINACASTAVLRKLRLNCRSANTLVGISKRCRINPPTPIPPSEPPGRSRPPPSYAHATRSSIRRPRP